MKVVPNDSFTFGGERINLHLAPTCYRFGPLIWITSSRLKHILLFDYRNDSVKYSREFFELMSFPVIFRFHSGSVPAPVNWNTVVVSQCFRIFKNVIHSLEPSATPSYFGVSPGSKQCVKSLNTPKHAKRIRYFYGLVPLIFSSTVIQYCRCNFEASVQWSILPTTVKTTWNNSLRQNKPISIASA